MVDKIGSRSHSPDDYTALPEALAVGFDQFEDGDDRLRAHFVLPAFEPAVRFALGLEESAGLDSRIMLGARSEFHALDPPRSGPRV